MIGFAGAHRSGKTTLARAVAQRLGRHFHDAAVTRIMREAGFDGVADLPILQRIAAQEFLLKRYIEELRAAPRPAITDRTPLDMIAYTLGEVTMHNTDATIVRRIHDHVEHCLDETVRNFDVVFVVRPLPHFDADPSKPPFNPAYQWETQFLIEGAANQLIGRMRTQSDQPGKEFQIVTLETLDLDERITQVCDTIASLGF